MMNHSRTSVLAALPAIWAVCLALTLSSCGGDQGDDLDQFMQNAAKDMKVKIEPIPEVKPYSPFEYNADGTLHDPFKARKAQSSRGVQPNLNRTREPLEGYPLESLKYVGSLSKANLKYALIKTPDENIQQVKIGNYVGQNFGIVTDINDDAVVLKEIVQDELSGDWTERTSSMGLQE
ncbi:pilus assembly protein PilP [Methylovorus mays]|uniref:pilus assembly protein PilP n=1 Tax=Methylovorus mays TaxID=184077 RepID=UPI001E659935|nr:pilus assembly protein PilP [Methylovorus mays]MCB5208023.1 pilus assembly protein PilP [Methylovorus mays]